MQEFTIRIEKKAWTFAGESIYLFVTRISLHVRPKHVNSKVVQVWSLNCLRTENLSSYRNTKPASLPAPAWGRGRLQCLSYEYDDPVAAVYCCCCRLYCCCCILLLLLSVSLFTLPAHDVFCIFPDCVFWRGAWLFLFTCRIPILAPDGVLRCAPGIALL